MRLNIPEFDAFNGSYIDSLKAVYSLTSYQTQRLNEKFSTRAINSLKDYEVGILMKIMRSFYSFIIVVEQAKDYTIAASIIRIIADNLASFLLIYHQEKQEERELRHYLFILDGLSNKLCELESYELTKTEHISDSEFKQLAFQIQNSKKNTKQGIEFCKNKIYELPLYLQYKDAIESISKKDYNWRYIDLEHPKKSWTWAKMYELIDTKKSVTKIFPYFSQYIHGLSISNLEIDNTNEDYEALIAFGIDLIGKISDIINSDFGVDGSYLLDGFLLSDQGRDYLSFYSSDRIADIMKIIKNNSDK